MEEMVKRKKILHYTGLIELIVSVVIIIGFLIAYLAPYNKDGKLLGLNYNVVSYAVVLSLAFFVFTFLNYIFFKKDKFGLLSDNAVLFVDLATVILAFAFIIMAYINETTKLFAGSDLKRSFIREKMPYGYVMIISILLIIGIIYTIRGMGGYKLPKSYRLLFAFLMSLVGGSFSYASNIFQNQMWGLYHIHAYTNSIVSVMNLQPYSDTNCSIYGHYGLIYYPFVKILGNDTRAILIVVGMFAVMTYLFTFYVLDNLILNDNVFCMAVLAAIGTTITFFGAGNYFQILPHRTLLPALAVAIVVWFENRKIIGLRKLLIELAFGTVSIVFNLETGLVSLIVIEAYEIISTDFTLLKIVKKFSMVIVYSTACILLAFILVNVYNSCTGGDWNTFKTFIYPIGSEQYDMSKILRTPIQNPFTGYTIQIITFSLVLFSVVWHIWSEKQSTKSMMIQAVISVSGLASLVYFMNRSAASCLAISHIQFIAILFVLTDRLFSNMEDAEKIERHRKSIEFVANNKWSIVACVLAFYFSIESIASIGLIIDNRSSSTWEKESVNEDYINAEQWIPKKVRAFGMGVPEIYYQCKVDSQIYVTDWAGDDMTSDALKEIASVLRENKEIVISSKTLERSDIKEMLNTNGYYETDRFEGTNFTLVDLKR